MAKKKRNVKHDHSGYALMFALLGSSSATLYYQPYTRLV